MRIIFLPVDERFCTRDYFLFLTHAADLEVLTPSKKLLGQKKVPADVDEIHRWLDCNVRERDILILSIDMLLHGGLKPSRVNLLSLNTLRSRLKILEKLRKRNVKIYLAATITRIPKYNSDDEEPVYWEYFGEKMYRLSLKLAKNNFKIDRTDLDIPEWIINDFLWRRKRNYEVVSNLIDLVKNKIIDFLNITLDDNSEGSLSVYEARLHKEKVENFKLSDKVSIHPGADESTMTLLSKALCDYFGISPVFRVVYSNPEYKDLIPPYEGDPLCKSIKNHIEASGGRLTEANKYDILMFVNNNDNPKISESPFQPEKPENGRNYFEIFKYLNKGIVGIADVKYANGADNFLVKLLLRNEINWSITNYYGWNTAGNTIGTTCAHSIIQFLGKAGKLSINEEKMRKYQAVLLLEHWGYQANVRQKLIEEMRKKGYSQRTLIPVENWAKEYCAHELELYKREIEKAFNKKWNLGLFFPCHRPFDIGIVLSEISD